MRSIPLKPTIIGLVLLSLAHQADASTIPVLLERFIFVRCEIQVAFAEARITQDDLVLQPKRDCRMVRTLVGQDLPAGSHGIRWGGDDERGNTVPSGVYFYRLDTVDYSETKRMTLLK